MMRPRSTSARARAALTLPALAVLAFARAASAQPSEVTRAGDAERLFREGRAAMEAGDLVTACPKFAESERLDPAPGTLLSLADCEERGKKLAKAREHYQLAASGFPKRDPRRAFATGRAQALEKRLAHVVLRVPAASPAELVVRVADTVVPSEELGASTPVDPGTLRIVVSARGRIDNVMTVVLAEGETRELVCAPGELEPTPPNPFAAPQDAAPAPSTPTPEGPRRDVRRTVAYVLLATGAASVIVGGVSGIVAAGKASTVKDHCTSDYACDQEGVDAAASGRFLSPLSTITLIAGAALVGGGVYFYFASAPSKRQPSAASLVVQPLVSTTGAGLRLQRDF